MEERIPEGAKLSNISDGGVFDPMDRKLKWGPFFDSTHRILAYRVSAPSLGSGPAALTGTASFDGLDLTIAGPRDVKTENNFGAANLRTIKRLPNGGVELVWQGEIGATYLLEATDDFVTWTELDRITPAATTFRSIDGDGAALKHRFYRAKRAPSGD